MQLRWTAEAANDLERIADYLLIHAPDRAPEMVRAVCDAPRRHLCRPHIARGSEVALTPLLTMPKRRIVSGVTIVAGGASI
jgi:plasmid stabilization system protein ParE